jgi:hypothetical protein
MGMPHVRFTIRWLMAIVVGVGVALWLARPYSQHAALDGVCTYTIQVHSASRAPIRTITCEAFADANEAAYNLERLLAPNTRLWSAQADPFVGQALSVDLPWTIRVSRGRVIHDVQYRSLLVIVRFGDGRQMGKVMEIPHRDKARAVRVEFP